MSDILWIGLGTDPHCPVDKEVVVHRASLSSPYPCGNLWTSTGQRCPT
jgi:hypothetical protein